MKNEFRSFKQLKELVSDSGDVLTVTMEDLRDAQGAAKLGKYVVQGIRDSLSKQGLKCFPRELPLFQSECVRIYTDGTPISKLYDAMMDVENWDRMEENFEADSLIRETVNNEAHAVISQIKQMVCW